MKRDIRSPKGWRVVIIRKALLLTKERSQAYGLSQIHIACFTSRSLSGSPYRFVDAFVAIEGSGNGYGGSEHPEVRPIERLM